MGRLMLLILLPVFIASALAPRLRLLALAQKISGFISIDCGAPNPYLDGQTKIYYEMDEGFIDSGENKNVSSDYSHQNYLNMSKSLRSFPNGVRNCYTLKPDRGKNNPYLIRAIFWYGNYDGKNEAPTFDLYIDVHYWGTVNYTTNAYEEIIYVPQADYLQVCVVNTGSGTPYISALELRALDNTTYRTEFGFLQFSRRFNMGPSNQSYVRYPLDVYDRIWTALLENYGIGPSTAASATTLANNNDAYKVPWEVLRTAETVRNVGFSLSYSWTPFIPNGKWILYFHFAEIQSGQQREFTVSINGNQFTKSVTLEYLKPVTLVSPLVTGSSIISISPTSGSADPPILNAIEVYNIVELPLAPTAQEDVKAINDTKATYQVDKESWQGDPCIPRNYTWDGLNCSYVNPPRIISLNLSSSNLIGNIASSFSKLAELESLDLSNNQLSGEIPETLAKLPKLTNLNLSGNKLTGSVPKALLTRRDADKTFKLSLDGNPDLCQADPCSQKKNKKSITVPVIAVVLTFLVVLLCALGTNCLIKRKPNRGLAKLKSYKSGEISRIINKEGIIGEGAFGKVHLCTLEDDTRVAVKVLSKSSWQGRKEFQAELHLSVRAHHGNLVSLLGYCDRCTKMALVYEYMANGNLQEHLTGKKPNVLNWKERLKIALDVAHGLEYLHNGCKPAIIHRDLKTSNILLDENMVAKISDFGLSRDFTAKSGGYVSSSPLGTPGYIPPEHRSLNKESDVYSFGIVLFELITGHPAMMQGDGSKSVEILDYVTPFIKNGNNMLGLMDPRLEGTFDIDSARKAIEIAESCTREKQADRPDIGEVLTKLKALVPKELALETKSEEGEPNERLGMTSSEHDPMLQP